MTFADVAKSHARIAIGRLGWRPRDFWAATPADLRLAIEGLNGGGGAFGQADLARLMAQLEEGENGTAA